MSTLTVSNIKKTGETASRDVAGVAAAWVNFNGTGTAAIQESMNVASLTDNSAGNYSVSLTNSLASTSFTVSTNGTTSGLTLGANTISRTASNLNILCSTSLSGYMASSTRLDHSGVDVLAHGDLA